eukprot:CAMPEP_0174261086 /NCGR_PEP_ID=MMETSP0439-20130205/11224_1 /TAXON_ID=0 /ORGANISM="Stereomyxa ramosa, Strain Chinc5" /LENGTH=337 /DNA_ID=CAMNT_0015345505 /DNA_START=243 /DNA_END=1256 /DNA_ORIENTATION=-
MPMDAKPPPAKRQKVKRPKRNNRKSAKVEVAKAVFDAFFERSNGSFSDSSQLQATKHQFLQLMYLAIPPTMWVNKSWVIRLLNKVLKDNNVEVVRKPRGYVVVVEELAHYVLSLKGTEKLSVVKIFWEGTPYNFSLPTPEALTQVDWAMELYNKVENHPVLKGQYKLEDILTSVLGYKDHPIDVQKLSKDVLLAPVLENPSTHKPVLLTSLDVGTPPLKVYVQDEKLCVQCSLFFWKGQVEVKTDYDTVEVTLHRGNEEGQVWGLVGDTISKSEEKVHFIVSPPPQYEVDTLNVQSDGDKLLLTFNPRQERKKVIELQKVEKIHTGTSIRPNVTLKS